MSRIRSLKPGFFTDADLAEVPALHRILFAGLWCQADREGRLEDKPRELKVKILPFDQLDVHQALDDLHRRGFILRYQVDGRRLIWVVAFKDHQRPHKDEKASEIPAPPPFAGNFPGEPEATTHEPGNFPAKTPDHGSLITGSGSLVADSGKVSAADVQAFLDWTKIKRPEELGATVPDDKSATKAGKETLRDGLEKHGRQKLEVAYLAFLGDRYWLGKDPPCPIHGFLDASQLPEYLSAAERFLGQHREAG